MSKMLHLSSHTEARNNFDRTAASRVELPTLDLHTYRSDTTVRQASCTPLAQPIEEASLAPAKSTSARHSQATQSNRRTINSSGSRAGINSRDCDDIHAQLAFSDTEHLDRVNGTEPDITKLKPGIVVIHSRAVFRDCFVRCLEISYRDHAIFSFTDIAEWCNSTDPDAPAAAVVILVIENGDEFSVANFQILESAAANMPVIIVSDVDDLDHIVRTLKSGVRGYIPTSLPFNVAVEAVRLVKAGGTFVPASSLVHDRNGQQPTSKTTVFLTDRQMKVVEAIRHGKPNKQIAYELKMSEHTVKVHLRHIMRKLKARNRTEVAVLSRGLFAGSNDQPRLGSDIGPDKDFKGV